MEPSKTTPTQNKWTPWQVEELKKLLAAGLTQKEIAERIGVTKNAVNGKVKGLGLAKPKQIRPWTSRNVDEERTIAHPWKPGDPKPEFKL